MYTLHDSMTNMNASFLRNKKMIVVIEDSLFIRDLLKCQIRYLGHRCLAFNEVRAAIQFVMSEPVDVIIAAHTMSGMKGLELLDYFNCHEIKPQIPKIMLSGSSDSSLPAKAKSYGAAGFIKMPYTLRKLSDVLTSTLAVAEKQMQPTKEN